MSGVTSKLVNEPHERSGVLLATEFRISIRLNILQELSRAFVDLHAEGFEKRGISSEAVGQRRK